MLKVRSGFKMRNTRCEQMFTALPPTTDILAGCSEVSVQIQHRERNDCGRELGGYLPKLIRFRIKWGQSLTDKVLILFSSV